MKKLLIFSLLLIISCGPSEEEIQASIDEAAEQATSTSSTISSSTTSISSTLPLSTSSTSSTTTSSSSTSTTTTTTSSTTETTTTSTLNLITYTEPSVASDSIEICKIKEASQTRGFTWAGFPQLTPLTKTTGTVKWALLPVDFACCRTRRSRRSSRTRRRCCRGRRRRAARSCRQATRPCVRRRTRSFIAAQNPVQQKPEHNCQCQSRPEGGSPGPMADKPQHYKSHDANGCGQKPSAQRAIPGAVWLCHDVTLPIVDLTCHSYTPSFLTRLENSVSTPVIKTLA